MLPLVILTAILGHTQAEQPPRRVLVLADARFTIPEVVGPVVCVRDCNEDGVADLFLARGTRHGNADRIDIVSGKDGGLIRTVWSREKKAVGEPVWAAGGDADGDGYPDLILGNRRAASNAGEVSVLSGGTGAVLVRKQGLQAEQRLGAAVLWLGDADGDGRDDFAVSSVECDLEFTRFLLERRLNARQGAREFMQDRCVAPGEVTACSGTDGSVLWRSIGTYPGAGFGSVLSLASDVDHDGVRELIVQPDLHAGLPARVLSGKTGTVLSTLETLFGPVLAAGDVDADNVDDYILVSMDEQIIRYTFASSVISGKTRSQLMSVKHPDEWSTHARLVSLGDLDSDGHADIGIGDTYFCVHESLDRASPPDPRQAGLGQMVSLESRPRGGRPWESGCAVVYSGKSGQPLFGIWAEYGSHVGLGFDLLRIDDINTDGRDDILVTGHDTAYAFATPPLEAAPK
ncbi:MAG: hypothetical protein JNL28_01225 [Planctomycetes bacterium]|nr:hypothetical protein [Planctomycetota bacterium]